MINRAELLKNLQSLLPHIEKDILAYSESREDLTAHLKAEYNKAREAGRTAEHFVAWREAQITQAAVAWVLSCVFVRFLEDNGLLQEAMLAGPVENEHGDKRLDHAKQRMVAYYNENPTHEDREYLFSLFEQLEKYPVIAELLDHKHNPLWQIPVSADGAKRLIDFFQKIDAATGEIVHDFTDVDWDTRFLGDLYQDLSEAVRKRYALLQTPEFVESFILDYTLEKAKETFGLPGLRLIDPTCGSGHFLLTTFDRVFEDWLKREPATNTRELAQRALDVVHGVDINPYAIAICRFRLLIAAMKAAGTRKVKDAPDFHFNLACGDSLLHGRRFEWQGQGQQTDLIDEDPVKHVLEVEDKEKLLKILGQQYHAVVGNPPYITASDKALNAAYRDRYLSCHRKFSLGVPFTERFFDLTLSGKESSLGAGFVGMITTNSFMKREFGKKLIENYLPSKELSYVIDTSGCQIPGHGTPTVILFARNRNPISENVRAVLGIKGEPSTVEDASKGRVWNSIIDNINDVGALTDYISVEDRNRDVWSTHPWSLEGGGAGGLKEVIESNPYLVLDDIQDELGFGGITGEDGLFTGSSEYFARLGVDHDYIKGFVEGDVVRNWSIESDVKSFFPYDNEVKSVHITNEKLKHLWFAKKLLRSRIYFGQTQEQRNLNWYEYGYISSGKCAAEFLIGFAFVATHNHFSLERQQRVFKQSAPVIKLKNGTVEADHLVLLGLLNSSVACFWGRQVFFPKGGYSEGKWEERLEWDGTKLKKFPIPQLQDSVNKDTNRLLSGYCVIENFAREIDALSQQLSECMPSQVIDNADLEALIRLLEDNKIKANEIRSRMVALQEELDWQCYQAYGLISEALIYKGELPLVNAGERAFEIAMAREIAADEGSDAWFSRHQLVQTTTNPKTWPDDYKALVDKRLSVMQSNPSIKMLEKPEYKRRWMALEWEKLEQHALKNSLLNFLEKSSFSVDQPALLSCAQLADKLNKSTIARSMAQRYTGTDLFDVQKLVVELMDSENVPQMAAARFKPDAMKKFRAWQEIWDKQRIEDEIDVEFGVDLPLKDQEARDAEKLAAFNEAKRKATAKKFSAVGEYPLPPVYAKTDFRSAKYETIRGKLDVPKERFFSLPGCEKEGDATLVIGWAGMNHLQRAQAIASWYLDRKESDGWEADKLTPMLVAIDELIPWLKQWHNDIDLEFGERMGDYYEGFLLEELRQLNISRDELLAWEPPAAPKKQRAAKKKKATAE